MDVRYIDPGFAHSIDSIMLFWTEGETPYWSDAMFYFYPQLDKGAVTAMSAPDKKRYIVGMLSDVYSGLRDTWAAKLTAYNGHWANCRAQVNDALSDAFGTDVRPLFNDLKGMVTLNPVCPRFLRERYFDVFHLNSERGAVGLTIHEMIHYIWFHMWNLLYHDSYDEYERPDMKWILSEMVVESIMRDERLSSINPYFPREDGGCVYGYFQDMVIDGAPILDTLDDMYRACGMAAFMERSYGYCLRHEQAIRAHIAQAEQTF